MLHAKGINKSFGDPPHQVLFDINFKIPSHDLVSITGKSGSGKSTLLYIISTLDQPTSGQVIIDDRNVSEMTDDEIHLFRNLEMGFVFQFHYLLPELTALENVLMPARKSNQHNKQTPRAYDLLAQFGLKGKENRLPGQLSGGEQQRVAIARAMIMKPKFLFADEPTGNLDSSNGIIVMDLLKQIVDEHKTTVVYVTHDPDYSAMANRKIELVDGRLVE